MKEAKIYDAIVVGGGPAGATAASELRRSGLSVLLLERNTRIKPCGGAVPPRLIEEFAIPDHLIVAHINTARIISPKNCTVDMPIRDGYVGMVDRETFDEWLRQRAEQLGAERRTGDFERLHHLKDGRIHVEFADLEQPGKPIESAVARVVVGADGANSKVASQAIYDAPRMSLVQARNEIRRFVPGDNPMAHVTAYHEIVAAPPGYASENGSRCDVIYNSELSPDFYAWVFPHGDTISIGVGSAQRGFDRRNAVTRLRQQTGLDRAETVRREGAPIPLRVLRRWDDGRNVVLAGDAAGVVAPASGEGIYYAMTSGQLAAEAAAESIRLADPRKLARAHKRFMREHGQVFRILGMMQRYWYTTDDRRERFVAICRDRDVQDLTWKAYMNKRLVRAKPLAHARIFFKNVGHLTGLASA